MIDRGFISLTPDPNQFKNFHAVKEFSASEDIAILKALKAQNSKAQCIALGSARTIQALKRRNNV
jgi:hypothetical protein